MKIRRKHLIVFLLVVLSLTLIGCGGGVSQKQYDDLQAQLDQAQKDTTAAKSQLSSVQKDFDTTKAQLTKDYDTAKSQLDTTKSENTKLQGTISNQSDTIRKTQEEVSQLENQLNAILDTEMTQYYQVSYPPYHYNWNLTVTLKDYFDYKEQTRSSDLSAMVTLDDAALISLAGTIRNSSFSDNLKPSDKVNLIAKFTQSLPHTDMDVKTAYDSYPRYPLETLVDQGGDSQDTSILAVTLLSLLDFDVVLLSFDSEKHVAVGVNLSSAGGYYWEYQGKRYYYLGTTGDYRKLGECPTQYIYLTPTIYPVG